MDNKVRFQEMLSDILEVARVQGNQLGINEVKAMFGDMPLSEEQYEHVFAYLAANNIKMIGYIEKENEYVDAVKNDRLRAEFKESEKEQLEENKKEKAVVAEDIDTSYDEIKKESSKGNKNNNQEDSAYLKMYLEDLEGVPAEKEDEVNKLILAIRKGDLSGKTRLLEIYLRKVVDIAQNYKNRGVSLEDLIQEGNIGLMYGVETFADESNDGDEIAFIKDSIVKYMELAILEEAESDDFEKSVIDKMTYIKSAAKTLEKELSREATIHELATYLKMQEEEVIDILNMSVDAIKLSHEHDHKHEDSNDHKHHHDHHHMHDNISEDEKDK